MHSSLEVAMAAGGKPPVASVGLIPA